MTKADQQRAYASGFVANTNDSVDGGLVPVIRDDSDGYDICVECGTETDNGTLHHGIGCRNQ